MAQVVERIWRSGPRRVKRSAWGYTLMVNGKQVRKYNAAWSKQDAQDALAARIVDRDVPPPLPPAPVVTFKQMTERYLREKEASKKKNLQSARHIIARLLTAFGETTSAGATDDRVGENGEAARARHREP
jgi:hypothetical protein